MSKEAPDFVTPPPPKNDKICSAFSYNFRLALTVEILGWEVKQQEQKKTNVRKFISVVKKYTDMTQLDATILREFVEQIRVSDTYTTDEQQKRVKIREIEIVYNFIGAFDFEEAREQSQTAQDKNNAKVGAA